MLYLTVIVFFIKYLAVIFFFVNLEVLGKFAEKMRGGRSKFAEKMRGESVIFPKIIKPVVNKFAEIF